MQVPIARVSANFFSLLGVEPQLGRAFNDDEGRPEGEPVVMLSDSIWKTRFNGDLHIVERIHLVGTDALADDLEIAAPHVFTHPWKTTRKFQRVRGPKADIAEGVCLQGSFAEGTDEHGDAVFVPAPQAEGGNPAPPPSHDAK